MTCLTEYIDRTIGIWCKTGYKLFQRYIEMRVDGMISWSHRQPPALSNRDVEQVPENEIYQNSMQDPRA